MLCASGSRSNGTTAILWHWRRFSRWWLWIESSTNQFSRWWLWIESPTLSRWWLWIESSKPILSTIGQFRSTTTVSRKSIVWIFTTNKTNQTRIRSQCHRTLSRRIRYLPNDIHLYHFLGEPPPHIVDDRNESSRRAGIGDFPKELVAYLRSIVELSEGAYGIYLYCWSYFHIFTDDDLVTKCLEECATHEEALCLFQESSRLVESIFGASPTGALAYIDRLMTIKRAKLVELINGGCSARTVVYRYLRNFTGHF